METSATYTTGKNSAGGYVKIVIKETATSTASNTSTLTITATAYVVAEDEVLSTGQLIGSCELTIGSEAKEFLFYSSKTGSGTHTVTKTATMTITHDVDGSCAVEVSGTANLFIEYNTTYEDITLSGGTMELTDIPQDYIASALDATTGGTCSVTWTPTDSSYVYVLEFAYGSTSVLTDTIAPGSTDTYTYTEYVFENDVWAAIITKAESATVTVTLYTYDTSGGLVMSSAASITVKIDEDVAPTITFEVSDAAGYADNFGYLANYSKITWAVIQSAELYGATVTYNVSICGTTYEKASGTTGVLTKTGDQTCSVTATDSRGRSASESSDIYVYEYAGPSIKTLTTERDTSDPTAAESAIAVTYSDLDGSNQIESMTLYSKASSDTDYDETAIQDYSQGDGNASGSYSWPSGTFSETASYDIQLVVTDTAGCSTVKSTRLSTTAALLGLRAGGKGLGVGKLPEGDYFDIGMDVVINSGYTLTLGDKTILIDYGSAQLEQLSEEESDSETEEESDSETEEESDSETEEESDSETTEGMLTAEVAFATAFTSAPHVILTLESDSPADGVVISVSDITESGCVVWAYWPDGYSATVHWLAIGA